ncbi:protein N-terminal asparagine amidohydrolase-like [Glandiceps talaboti]
MQESSVKLCSEPVRQCVAAGLLYISQREFATVIPQHVSIDVIGSEDATTCHITVLRHTGSNAVCLSHCDGSGVEGGIKAMLQEITTLSHGKQGCLELHLVGGFADDKKTSEQLSLEILNEFHKHPEEIHLKTACITDLNDIVKDGVHGPIIYGVGVNVKTGEMYPASFADKGPDEAARSARNFVGIGKHMSSVYDFTKRQLRIGPYQYRPWPDARFWLLEPDEVILQYLSTSPLVEPPNYVQHVRNALKHIIEHRNPEITLFPGGKPRLYEKDSNGLWMKVDHST